MDNHPLFILAVPLLAAFGANLLRLSERFKHLLPLVVTGALAFSSVASLDLLRRILTGGTLRYTVGGWKAPYGIELLIDPLAALMMLLISVVALMASFSSLESARFELPDREHVFFSLYLVLVAGLLGLVMTADAFNLYVLLEITSIATYGLIAMGPGRAPLASFNYVIMGTIGACFYLLGVGYLYILTGSLNMADIAGILAGMRDSVAVATAFAFMLVGLWIKMALFPLHGWLPRAYTHAPMSTSVLVAPLMTKVTVYLMIRVIFSIFIPASEFLHRPEVQTVIVWVAVVAIVSGSILAFSQTNLKQMLTYIIVAEVGYMVGGVWLANQTGLTGAILHIVNDALMTLCLFLAAAALIHRTGSLDYTNLKGAFRSMPLTMAAFCVGAFSMIGVPPTCGFFSKWYLILGGIEAGRWEFVAALVISSLVNAVIFFRIFEIAFFRIEAQDGHVAARSHEAPLMLLVPLLLVAAGLLAAGLGAGTIVSKVILFALPGGF